MKLINIKKSQEDQVIVKMLVQLWHQHLKVTRQVDGAPGDLAAHRRTPYPTWRDNELIRTGVFT
jgi:hypothetical protein